MCLYPQYVQVANIAQLRQQGFNALLSCGKVTILSNKDYVATKFGLRINSQIIKAYVSVDDDNDKVYAKNDKLPYKHYYRDYKTNPLDIQYINTCTGQSVNLYIEVPCGYCEDCLASKKHKLVDKVFMHSATHGSPYFVTLTFDSEHEHFVDPFELVEDEHFKENRKALKKIRVEIIQKFLKRLRKSLSKDYPGEKLTYCITSERGKKGRYHFHGLFWFRSPQLFDLQFFTILSNGREKTIAEPKFATYVRRAWPFGFVACFVDRDKNGNSNAGTYCTKYMTKTDNWKENINLKSRLAVDKLKEYTDFIRNNPTKTKIEVLSESGKVKNIAITSWMLDKIIPSINRSIKHRDRYIINLYNHLTSTYGVLKGDEWFMFKHKQFYQKLQVLYNYGYLSENTNNKPTDASDKIKAIRTLIKLDKQMRRIYRDYNFAEIVFLDSLRRTHNEYLMSNITDTDNTLIRLQRQEYIKQLLEKQSDNQ